MGVSTPNQPHPMKLRQAIPLAAFVLSVLNPASAAELAGHWTAEFDSQIGLQKYTYDFKAAGDTLTGTATHDHSMGRGVAPLKDIKVNGEEVAFTETASFEGNELVITYTGKITGDEMKLTRKVGDFGTEQIVVQRAKKPAAAK